MEFQILQSTENWSLLGFTNYAYYDILEMFLIYTQFFS